VTAFLDYQHCPYACQQETVQKSVVYKLIFYIKMLLLFLLVGSAFSYQKIPDCTPSDTWGSDRCGIRAVVEAYLSDGTTGNYGPIEDWDTSLVTDMSWVFHNKLNFNENLSGWDTSRVTTMRGMFAGALLFNKPIFQETSSVNDMSFMFQGASAFNQDLSGWDTTSVTLFNNFYRMFYNSGFTQILCWKMRAEDLQRGKTQWQVTRGSSKVRLGCCPVGTYMLDSYKTEHTLTNCQKCAFKTVENTDPQCCPVNSPNCRDTNHGMCLDATCTSVVCYHTYGDTDSNTANGCEPCPIGKFQLGGGPTCKDCVVGKYQDSRRSTCKDCFIGKFQDQGGQTSCKHCVAGKYQDQSGEAKCIPCGNNGISPFGSQDHSNCFDLSSIPKSMLKAAYSEGCSVSVPTCRGDQIIENGVCVCKIEEIDVNGVCVSRYKILDIGFCDDDIGWRTAADPSECAAGLTKLHNDGLVGLDPSTWALPHPVKTWTETWSMGMTGCYLNNGNNPWFNYADTTVPCGVRGVELWRCICVREVQGVLCPGQPATNYCDGDGDCGDEPVWCDCPAGLALCDSSCAANEDGKPNWDASKSSCIS